MNPYLTRSDKELLWRAVKHGRVGISDARGIYRCGEDRARYLLQRFYKQGYLTKAVGGGFAPTNKAEIEVTIWK